MATVVQIHIQQLLNQEVLKNSHHAFVVGYK